MYALADYRFNLPEERIAQQPAPTRDQSRLLVLDRESGDIRHHRFSDLPELLSKGDLLVINNTEVIPGRLFGEKETGGKVELLILDLPEERARSKRDGSIVCKCLVKSAKRPRPASVIQLEKRSKATILSGKNGIYSVAFDLEGDFLGMIYRLGRVPLPPYIRRESGLPAPEDAHSYQTVYAKEKGAVAAPTAGLHFTPGLMKRLEEKGIDIAEITLHVGYGTFLPVRCEDIRDHRMHAEVFVVSEKAAAQIGMAREKGARVVAVGTTCVRTLEFVSDKSGRILPESGRCDLFIYPGYRFRVVDAMITNFHLPESTLLMLVSAFAGRKRILNAYREAIDRNYRFYSYGDAMLIL